MCKIWPTSLRWLGLEMRIRKHTILYKLYTNPEIALSASASLARVPGPGRRASRVYLRLGTVPSRRATPPGTPVVVSPSRSNAPTCLDGVITHLEVPEPA